LFFSKKLHTNNAAPPIAQITIKVKNNPLMFRIAYKTRKTLMRTVGNPARLNQANNPRSASQMYKAPGQKSEAAKQTKNAPRPPRE